MAHYESSRAAADTRRWRHGGQLPYRPDSGTRGYGRLGEGWALLVRRISYEQQREDNDWDFTGDSTEIERKPLLKASRQLRVEAVESIPALIDALKDEATRVIGAVETAKQIADRLK